jgi:PAS domain-containing protein
VAEGSSFSFDRLGQVTNVRGAAGPLAGDTVGRPAADAIRLLLDASEADGSPVIQLDAWHNGGETEVSVIGTATSPGAARAQSAYVPSTFDKAVAGLELYDSGLRILRSNPAALAIRGAGPDDVLDRSADALDPTLPLSPLLREAMDPERAAGARPVIERDVRKGPHVYSVLALPLREGATVIGAATIIHDVTESERSRKAEQLLAATHERVGRTLGVMRTA